jgi:SAM-dependent methyltransferase
MTTGKYTGAAAGWSQQAYADPESYLSHRADLVVSLGIELVPGDTVLDLACGDGGMAEFLLPRGLAYAGADLNEAMVAEARRRLEGRARIEHADLNELVPDEPVAATTLFRALYYVRDRAAFFRQVLAYTERKLVFDLNPRQYAFGQVAGELREAGFSRVVSRPFFVPQRIALPAPGLALARLAERSGPLARVALRFRFTYVVSALR